MRETRPNHGERARKPEKNITYKDRLIVPEHLRPWEVPVQGYRPPQFTTKWVRTTGVEIGASDPEDVRRVNFANRPSWTGKPYLFDREGHPLHPRGRQGVAGRGDLAKYGPNYAGDGGAIDLENDRLLLIRRKLDNGGPGQWAIVGGMVDTGESVDDTIPREVKEETGVDVRKAQEGKVVYRGLSGDDRDTDWAWVESTAKVFYFTHDVPTPEAGDDAYDAQWFDFRSMEHLDAAIAAYDAKVGLPHQSLYADHDTIIRRFLAHKQQFRLEK